MNYFNHSASADAIPLQVVAENELEGLLANQSDFINNQIAAADFSAKKHTFCPLLDSDGRLAQIWVGAGEQINIATLAHLPLKLAEGNYTLASDATAAEKTAMATGWGLGSYQFSAYKKAKRQAAKLDLPDGSDQDKIEQTVAAFTLGRTLINRAPHDMTPAKLAKTVAELAQHHDAAFAQIVGDDLLTQNYPAIHAVGRASDDAPHLVDLQWGDSSHPKLTLVGKGVCFDTGGILVKPFSSMALMKKDMGGAAHVIALAQMIMVNKLPVRLRLLIPAVDNAISGNAYYPSDVITMRSGKTVEVGHTDAEGRLILADALAEAVNEKPQLLIDFATLTGAARVALGSEIAAMFASQQTTATEIEKIAAEVTDPVWRLPLYKPYRKLIDSNVADICNAAKGGYGGAITAALFLQEFVPAEIDWLHFDVMGWNLQSSPGHPQGGELFAVRALFDYLVQRFND
ncbi:MAG: leucyl aminopeptidase family protein [Gammaproteobacteria bacterium]|nr:leucyl aminopeptidase family protein [Gammaproteobacteria bacterium]